MARDAPGTGPARTTLSVDHTAHWFALRGTAHLCSLFSLWQHGVVGVVESIASDGRRSIAALLHAHRRQTLSLAERHLRSHDSAAGIAVRVRTDGVILGGFVGGGAGQRQEPAYISRALWCEPAVVSRSRDD